MSNPESFEHKKLYPAGAYAHPSDVLADDGLTHDQKIVILREWYLDAVRLQDSAGESMGGGEPDRLQAVSDALLKLGVSPSAQEDSLAAPTLTGAGAPVSDPASTNKD